GLTDEEIERIKAGPDAAGWTPLEQAMLQATDELTAGGHVSDATWDALGDLTEKQRMDLIMTVGQYTQVSMMLNSFGVQLDDDLVLDHDLKA
ncbi:MAG: carboxymuconolactone decarboxylase family protein, partial [Parasphingorhabdus sp.]